MCCLGEGLYGCRGPWWSAAVPFTQRTGLPLPASGQGKLLLRPPAGRLPHVQALAQWGEMTGEQNEPSAPPGAQSTSKAPGKHFSVSCPAFQSECWKKENGLPPGAENPHGEIYHSQSRCFLANLTSQPLREDETRHPSEIPHPKEAELSGRCYLRQCTERGAYKVRAEGAPWAPCLPGKAIQVGVVSEKPYSTLAKGSFKVRIR